ncbi:hypothetical protein MUO93_11410 [Candidatus Bathyarchaeota archaeon]|nr:hypothetical protein [Candidatus Bathyarchaeota archaeon]
MVSYVGGKQPFTRFLISMAQFLAMYRVLGRRGASLEEAGELIYRVCEEVMGSYPGFVLKILGGSNFSGRHIRDLRRRAEESQRRLYPGGLHLQLRRGGRRGVRLRRRLHGVRLRQVPHGGGRPGACALPLPHRYPLQ